MPIATADRNYVKGTVGFFFRKEKGGSVLGVTCHHVQFADDNLDYKNTPSSPNFVRLLGVARSQKLLDDITREIDDYKTQIDLHERELAVMRANGGEAARIERKLAKARTKLDTLAAFYQHVKVDWTDSLTSNIGTIDYSPPIRSVEVSHM